jgi:chromosome segregation ATPase
MMPRSRKDVTMTAVAAAAPETTDTSLGDLRARAGELKGQVEKLELSLGSSRGRLQELLAERSGLILPARSGNDRGAQKRLDAIDEQVPVLKRDLGLDEAALAELRAQLISAENAVELAEWEIRRAEVRERITARLTGKIDAAIEKAVDSLAAALKAAQDEDESIAAAVASFVPALGREVRTTQRSAGSARRNLAALRLRKLLPIDEMQIKGWSFGEDPKFVDRTRQYYGEILEALDRLALVFQATPPEAI